MVDCTGLEIRRTVMQYRGFESHPLRQFSRPIYLIDGLIVLWGTNNPQTNPRFGKSPLATSRGELVKKSNAATFRKRLRDRTQSPWTSLPFSLKRLELPTRKLFIAQRVLADTHDARAFQPGLNGLVEIAVFVVKALNP